VKCSTSGSFQLTFPMKTARALAGGGIMALFVPQGDSHHGPQYGPSGGMGCFHASSRSLCPMNAPHPFAIFRVIRTRTRKIR
jgi:hypothetical protein